MRGGLTENAKEEKKMEFATLSLKDGDVLVARFRGPLTESQKDARADTLTMKLAKLGRPGVPVLVIDDGMDLAVITKAKEAK